MNNRTKTPSPDDGSPLPQTPPGQPTLPASTQTQKTELDRYRDYAKGVRATLDKLKSGYDQQSLDLKSEAELVSRRAKIYAHLHDARGDTQKLGLLKKSLEGVNSEYDILMAQIEGQRAEISELEERLHAELPLAVNVFSRLTDLLAQHLWLLGYNHFRSRIYASAREQADGNIIELADLDAEFMEFRLKSNLPSSGSWAVCRPLADDNLTKHSEFRFQTVQNVMQAVGQLFSVAEWLLERAAVAAASGFQIPPLDTSPVQVQPKTLPPEAQIVVTEKYREAAREADRLQHMSRRERLFDAAGYVEKVDGLYSKATGEFVRALSAQDAAIIEHSLSRPDADTADLGLMTQSERIR